VTGENYQCLITETLYSFRSPQPFSLQPFAMMCPTEMWSCVGFSLHLQFTVPEITAYSRKRGVWFNLHRHDSALGCRNVKTTVNVSELRGSSPKEASVVIAKQRVFSSHFEEPNCLL